MRTPLLVALAFLTCAGFSLQATSTQFPGGIPRIPRPNGPKATPTPESARPTPASETPPATQPWADAPAAMPQTAAASGPDQPFLMQDSLRVTAWTNNSFKGNYDVWSWVPKMKFRVWGPVPSGSQLYAVFQQPGGSAPWLTFDCETAETQKNYWRETECGGRQVEDKSLTITGSVSFTIKMRNELARTDTGIFAGRMKVAKTLSNEHGPEAANKFVYYVDHDWNLPIGYVFYTPDSM